MSVVEQQGEEKYTHNQNTEYNNGEEISSPISNGISSSSTSAVTPLSSSSLSFLSSSTPSSFVKNEHFQDLFQTTQYSLSFLDDSIRNLTNDITVDISSLLLNNDKSIFSEALPLSISLTGITTMSPIEKTDSIRTTPNVTSIIVESLGNDIKHKLQTFQSDVYTENNNECLPLDDNNDNKSNDDERPTMIISKGLISAMVEQHVSKALHSLYERENETRITMRADHERRMSRCRMAYVIERERMLREHFTCESDNVDKLKGVHGDKIRFMDKSISEVQDICRVKGYMLNELRRDLQLTECNLCTVGKQFDEYRRTIGASEERLRNEMNIKRKGQVIAKLSIIRLEGIIQRYDKALCMKRAECKRNKRKVKHVMDKLVLSDSLRNNLMKRYNDAKVKYQQRLKECLFCRRRYGNENENNCITKLNKDDEDNKKLRRSSMSRQRQQQSDLKRHRHLQRNFEDKGTSPANNSSKQDSGKNNENDYSSKIKEIERELIQERTKLCAIQEQYERLSRQNSAYKKLLNFRHIGYSLSKLSKVETMEAMELKLGNRKQSGVILGLSLEEGERSSFPLSSSLKEEKDLIEKKCNRKCSDIGNNELCIVARGRINLEVRNEGGKKRSSSSPPQERIEVVRFRKHIEKGDSKAKFKTAPKAAATERREKNQHH